MKRAVRALLAVSVAAAMVLALSACVFAAPAVGSGEVVKIICPYGVGGTADVLARKYADVATKLHPEYNFIVEQLTGGDGFAAATSFSEEKPSTKDLLVYGYGVAYRHDLGKKYETEVVDFDRSEILPLAAIDDRTWVLYTTPDQTLASILEKAKTSGVKMSGGNPLSDPHLAFGSLVAMEGGRVMVVPYSGGAAQKKGLIDGEVNVFVGTSQVGQEDVEAGNLIPILAFSEKTFDGFKGPKGAISVPCIAGSGKAPELDAAKDYTGSILPAGGFIAGHAGGDPEWHAKMIQVAKDVWASSEYSDFVASVLLNKFECYGDAAAKFVDIACEKALKAYEILSGDGN